MNSIQVVPPFHFRFLFDDNVPDQFRGALIDVATHLEPVLGTAPIRVTFGDGPFTEHGYPDKWWAYYSSSRIEIGFRATADPVPAAAHELWHRAQDVAQDNTIWMSDEAAVRGLLSAKENEATAVQQIYGSEALWTRWHVVAAVDPFDDWFHYQRWAKPRGVTVPIWATDEVVDPTPPTPPMLPPEKRPDGVMMRLFVPFKALAATARALNGAPMEATAIPLLAEEFYHPANQFQQEIARHFPVREWGHVARIMRRESGFNPAAACHDCFEVFWPEATGRPDWETVTQHGDVGDRPAVRGRGEWRVIPENSQGLLQINVVAWPQFAAWDLHDPDRACEAARIIFDDGRRQGDPYKHWRSADPRVFTPTAVI